MPKNAAAGIHSQLVKSHKDGIKETLKDWQLEIVSDDSLFNAFMKANIDYKGQLCSAYAQHGYGLKLSLQVDFGEILCPGASAALSVSAAGERTRYFLMVIQRQPRSLGHLVTHNPIAFLCLDGAETKVKLSVGGEIGIKTPDLPTGDLPECASFTLEASATASAEIAYTGTRLFLRDKSPRFYPAWTDAGLKEDFIRMVGPGGKREVKDEMLAFLDHDPLLKQFKPEKRLYQALTGGNVAGERLEKALNQALTFVMKPGSYTDAQKRAKIANKIRSLLLDMRAYQTYDASFFLGGRHEQAKQALAAKVQGTTGLSAEELFNRNANLCFLDLWSHSPEASASIELKATASVSLGVGLGSTAAEESPKSASGDTEASSEESAEEEEEAAALLELGVSASATASAKVGIEGSYKHTTYRYQTYVVDDQDPSRILIATQDTIITYKQIKGTASVSAELEASLGLNIGGVIDKSKSATKGVEKTAEKSFLNSMSYVSGICYWAPDKTNIVAESGSGYSYGHSVLAAVLVLRYDAYTANGKVKGVYKNPNRRAAAYLGALAAGLRVSLDDLLQFIQGCRATLETMQVNEEGEPQAVLVEACFAAPGPNKTMAAPVEIPNGDRSKIRLKRDGAKGSFRRTAIAAGTPQKGGPHEGLQAIRLRVRRADSTDQTEVKFTLGIKIGNQDLGIELTKVDRAGCEGIADLYTYWFYPYEALNRKTGNGIETAQFMGQEAAVPPVALLHQ